MKPWTPNDDDFCKCGGIFSKKFGVCYACGEKKTPDNRYQPGLHDWQPDEHVEVTEASAK